jgi:hypothetical protein
MLANAGVSQEVRMRMTGHSTTEINAVYTHHEIGSLREAIELIPRLKDEG